MLIILVLIITCSCSMKQAATTMTAKVIMDGMIAVESESDLWIAKQSIIPMVKSLEVLGAADPENAHFLGLMAKVYGNVAFGFLEPRYMSAPASEKSVWLRRVKRYYRLGGAAGMKSLEKRFGKGVTGSPQEFTSAIKKAKEKDLSVLFWTAFDLGNWINLNRDDVTSIVMLPKVEAMVDRVLEVDPEFGYGSALAFKAAMMTSRPTMLGGNPEKAAGIFEEAIKIKGGKYLMTKVMYAEWYAIPQKRGELSRRLLSKVASADAGNLPEQTLVNELAKERASILLATYGIK
jgi:hypothetical protein